MYCMNIVTIGCEPRVLAEVRREALDNLAIVDAEFVDLSEALNSLEADPDESRLFIIQVGTNTELGHLKRLSSTFVGHPVIALVDADKDSSMVVGAMRAGATQVVLLPFQSGDFGGALDCIAIQFGLVPARAKTIAVAGAAGGCGTTTIALNLAYEVACAKQIKCILMELSMRMGVLASLLDVEPRYTTSDLLFDRNVDSAAMKQVLTSIIDGFSILPGPYQSIEPGIIESERVLALIELTSRLAEVVILDVPCTFDELYFKTLAAADKFVLVTEQKVSSIRGVQMVCEALPNTPELVIVNFYDPKVQGLGSDRLKALVKCPNMAMVAYDPLVRNAGDIGKPLRLVAPRSRALADVRKLMEKLIPEELLSKKIPKPSTLLGRLSRAFTTSSKASP